ncbi:flagellar motor switch protein FliN [Agromyces humi]|uniref:flagellar motor switch protein FliN n=1 Tax=Agromyces humi TaxID=1766800 RepID=UPI001F21C520|nr:flagellar motor switch protein FliN [Agromyces humi]
MTTIDLSAVADALVKSLPTSKQLTAVPVPADGASAATNAYQVTLVGATSADLVVAFDDKDLLSSTGLSVEVAVASAFASAADVIGVGQISDVSAGGAAIIDNPDTTGRFELRDGTKRVGWFAVHVREGGNGGLDGLADRLPRVSNVEVTLTVVIGTRKLLIKDVLGFKPGDVVELDRAAGAPADIRVNNKLVAHGEVVVVDQDYGVRITRILDEDAIA